MKNFFVLALLLFSLSGYSQKIDGFYRGVLNNDSANKMVQEYELAIAMYKGKITGYSYVTFIVQDTFYYGIRKVKGEIVGDSIVVTDDKFISHNYPQAPAKGVKRTITIPLNGQDSVTVLSGNWKTNEIKRRGYSSVPGKIELARTLDSKNSPLVNHLKELGVASSDDYVLAAAGIVTEPQQIAVVDPIVKPATVEVASAKKDKKEKSKSNGTTEPAKENVVSSNETAKPNLKTGQPAETNNDVSKEQITAKKETKSKKEKTAIPEVKESVTNAPRNQNNDVVEKQTVNTEGKAAKTTAIETGTKKEVAKTIVVPEKIAYQQRTTINTKSVDVVSDSLILAFYDNGVVDGDSISVYLNGENIVSNIKLTTIATKRVIHLDNKDEVKLVLVAENLGSIPPNTGLMSIRDGDNIYQVHFSADMQTNASIIIRRKK